MITREEVLKIAKLSKLRFDEVELEDISNKLNKILKYMEEIDEVNVDGVEPLYNVLDLVDNTREDKVCNSVKKEDFLSNAPEKDEDFLILARIV